MITFFVGVIYPPLCICCGMMEFCDDGGVFCTEVVVVVVVVVVGDAVVCGTSEFVSSEAKNFCHQNSKKVSKIVGNIESSFTDNQLNKEITQKTNDKILSESVSNFEMYVQFPNLSSSSSDQTSG